MNRDSFYASIIKSDINNSRNYDINSPTPRAAIKQLHSSFSGSPSSSYVSRTHLPFTPGAQLLAHCLASANSSTRLYGSREIIENHNNTSHNPPGQDLTTLMSSYRSLTKSNSWRSPSAIKSDNLILSQTSPAYTTSYRSASHSSPNYRPFNSPPRKEPAPRHSYRPVGSSYYLPVRYRD